jgi:aspartyl/asparaginyl beta-hydroxylase (cupin superfamily)
MPPTFSVDQLIRSLLARPQDFRVGLAAGEALYRMGHREDAVAAWALADDYDPRVRRIKDEPDENPDMRAASARADRAFRAHFSKLHLDAIDSFARTVDSDLRRVRNAVWTMTHDGPIRFRTELQKPMIFYMPDLPASAVFPTEGLPWVPELESAWSAIRNEYERAIRERIKQAPYVPSDINAPIWEKLSGKLDWSALHLYKNSRPTEHTARFPDTLKALGNVDLVRVDGHPMEVFFSRLKPGAHIPPHFGLTNTRLTTHLPISVPDGCAIRVGEETHDWSEGRIVAFDDSFEHEAWNRSQRDRVVLIFEVHHPDLSGDERAAIEHTYSVRRNWLDNRINLLERHLVYRGSG